MDRILTLLRTLLDLYLPKKGGTMTGVITAKSDGVAPFIIDASDGTGNVDKAWLSASKNNGAFIETQEDGTIYSRLVLRYPSNSSQSGWFRLRASNASASSELIGTPDGKLTWNGNELAANANAVHTTGNETISGGKTFKDNIYFADGAGICFTKNGVTQRLIGAVLDSVEGNNAVNLRLGYGGSTYVTGGECSSQITADNGFAYGAENVQLMADGTIVFRAGLNSGWNADYGAILGKDIFRPLKAEAMTLGSATYPWGVLYAKNFYSTGDRFSFNADAATTSAIYRTSNTGNLNFYGGSWNYLDGANLQLVGIKADANAGCFVMNATNGTKAKALKGSYTDGLTWDGKPVAVDENVVHITGAETITGAKTFQGAIYNKYTTVTRGTAPDSNKYITNAWQDVNGVQMGGIQNWVYKTSGNNMMRMFAYKNVAGSDDYAALSVVYPTSGNPYGLAPTTPAGSDSTQIVTANYLNDKLTSVVHLADTENITGTKNFLAAPNIQRTNVTKGTAPSSGTWWTLGCADKEGVATKNRLGAFEVGLDTSNNVTTYLRAYKPQANDTTFAAVAVVYPASGSPYATAPATPNGSTGTQIVTAGFLNSTVAKYLPLAGGTMTGRIESSTNVALQLNCAKGDAYVVSANRTDTGAGVRFGIGSGGTNRGVYDTTSSKWIAYSDGTNACTQLGVTATSDDNATHIATTGWTKDVLASYATTSSVNTSVATKANISGNRGELAGYQTPLSQATALSVTYATRDISQITGAVKITVANSTSSCAWTKVVSLTNASATISLGSNWKWVNGITPKVSANSVLVLHWCKTFGIATLLATS
jgi:hypothetical protein